MFVPFNVSDFIDRAEQVYGRRLCRSTSCARRTGRDATAN